MLSKIENITWINSNTKIQRKRKKLRANKNGTDNLSQLPDLFFSAFLGENHTDFPNKISSKKDIFKIKTDYQLYQKNYIEALPYRSINYRSANYELINKKDVIDSIFFEIYSQTRSTYKAITRYLLSKNFKRPQ